ncbi:hypothetical protein V8C86DRAFT_2648539 [Haematococcus lacustris]
MDSSRSGSETDSGSASDDLDDVPLSQPAPPARPTRVGLPAGLGLTLGSLSIGSRPPAPVFQLPSFAAERSTEQPPPTARAQSMPAHSSAVLTNMGKPQVNCAMANQGSLSGQQLPQQPSAHQPSQPRKPPRLLLADPATSSPAHSPLKQRHTNSIQPSASGHVTVSLLSPAFVLPGSSLPPQPEPSSSNAAAQSLHWSTSARQAAVHQFSARLGVAADALQVWELHEHPPGQGSATGMVHHIAVSVNDSSFSLAAVEDMLQQNKQLQTTQQCNADTLGALYSDSKALSSSNAELQVKTAVQAKEIELLQLKLEHADQRARAAEARNAQLSETQEKLKSTIMQLRDEFMRLQPPRRA